MRKSDLINKVAQEARGLSCNQQDAEVAVKAVFASIEGALVEGSRVEVRGFGTFEVRHYGAYQGRNPKTGIQVAVNPKKSPFFKAGKELRENLNKVNKGQ